MQDIRLSENFWLREFLRSDVAARRGVELTASAEIIVELRRLCMTVLEPLRLSVGRPWIISSGYRPEWLNKAIGGSATSAHVYGRASDQNVTGMSTIALARMVAGSVDMLPIDQVIYEFGQWVHIGIAAKGVEPRRQVLTALYDAGKTRYVSGVVG